MTICKNPDWLALMAGIIGDPANDLRRLIVADWLEENGEADRAEFIRLQVDEGTPQSSREVDLGHANRLAWFGAGDGTRLRIFRESPWFSSPTAIGGDWPEFRVRRGFVAELHAPAAWVWGADCDRCDETNTACLVCDGTGHTPAHGYAVIRSHPVTKVVVTDREPDPTGWASGTDTTDWLFDSHPSALPYAVARHLVGGVHRPESEHLVARWDYPCRQDALDALSDAVIEAARSTHTRADR